MKFFAAATIAALPSANAIYHACCKRENTCPPGKNINSISPLDGGSVKVCCDDGATPWDDVPECLEDIANEGGPKIALYGMPEVASTSTNAEVTIVNTSLEVTSTSTNDNCCLTLAAAQPGKIRSAATHICPENMYTVKGAMHVTQDNMNYQVCCDEGALASEIDAGGFPTCEVPAQTPVVPTNAAAPPQQEAKPEDGSDNATQNPDESIDNGADVDAGTSLQQETNTENESDNASQTLVDSPDTDEQLLQETSLGDGSNSANAMDAGMIGMALVGVVLHAVM